MTSQNSFKENTITGREGQKRETENKSCTMASDHPADLRVPVPELRLVLLGNKHVGKSATGNAILGREAFRETETTECETQRGRVENRDILLIDTPGINNTSLTKERWRSEIEKCVALSAPGPHVFLLVIKLGEFTEDERNTVKWIQENFGEEALKFTMILFIGREDMTCRRWSNFCQDIQDFTRQVGCGYHVINSKKECNPAQISKILKHINEMVGRNREQYYHDETLQARREQRPMTNEEKNKEEKQQREYQEEDWEKHERRRQEEEKEEEDEDEEEEEEEDYDAVDDDFDDDDDRRRLLPNRHDINLESQRERERVTSDQGCDVRIVLLGIACTGKSATGNTILGREAFLYRRRKTATEFKREDGRVEDGMVSVIDIKRPNNLFSCTTRTCPMVSDELRKAMSRCSPGPHVFLLVIRSHQSIRKFSDKLEKRFGREFLNRTIVLLTHGDRYGRDHKRVFNRSSELQNLVNSCSGFYQIFNNEEKGDRTQVRELMDKIDRVIKKNGGQHYTTEMYLEAQRRYCQRNRCSVM